MDDAHHPFATAAFASLLVQLGSTIEILHLGSTLPGLAIKADDILASPHNGVLDMALSHCKALSRVQLCWDLAGPNVFESLKCASSSLEEVVFVGIPETVTAAAMGGYKLFLRFMFSLRVC